MLLPTFYFGTYFAPNVYMDVLFFTIMERYWSTKIVVRNTQCTWTLILYYNVNKLASLKLWKLARNKVLIRVNRWSRNLLSLTATLNNDQLLNNKADKGERYLDADVTSVLENLVIDFLPFNIHKINTVPPSVQQPGMTLNMAAAVSVQAGLELFNPSDIQMNLASSSKSPIIFDTRANLAITGNKPRFSSRYIQGGLSTETRWNGCWC